MAGVKFEQAMARLQSSWELEKGDLPLDEVVEDFRRGHSTVQELPQSSWKRPNARVEVLVQDKNGKKQLRRSPSMTLMSSVPPKTLSRLLRMATGGVLIAQRLNVSG